MKTTLAILALAWYGYSQNMDSSWAVVRQDSINAAVKPVQVADVQDVPTVEQQPAPHDRFLVDSIGAIVDRDSALELSAAAVFFKKQLTLKKFDLDTRLECLEFLLAKQLRTKSQAVTYLSVLKQYCDDRQAMYYAARRTVPDSKKYLAGAYMHKSQENCGRVQSFIERIEK